VVHVPAYSSNLRTLSKSINGFRKTTKTSLKIISKNIKNRNRIEITEKAKKLG